ncbi:MAG: adenosylcobinamide-phosphate synthase CbiB [Alistipes senegalensis]|nr:adenosylcobinamide-phosphate synthase CbiB [Alistipes senegalensis]
MKFIILIFPMIFGFIIDCILGDPYHLPHPIRVIGNFISATEKWVRRIMPENLRFGGVILALMTIFFTVSITLIILFFSYKNNILIGLLIESIMCYYMIASKCLKKESMKVYKAISEKNVKKAREAVSMIVGRDTENLDKSGIIRATVETVAENTSDGVTAPIMYISAFGAIGGFFYKAVNTMDSMIGYTNEKYADIGRFAAKLDDLLNFIPSRITALVMIFSAYILGFDGKNALKIWRRDRRNHASPNSAQTEAVCAGALGVRLGGDAYYFGKLHKKQFIGDNIRNIENEDIVYVNKLMYMTSFITLIIGTVFRAAVWGAIL